MYQIGSDDGENTLNMDDYLKIGSVDKIPGAQFL